MTDQGYHKTQADHCVFVKKFEGGDFLILLLYVDDMLIVGRDQAKIRMLKKLSIEPSQWKTWVRQDTYWGCTSSGIGERSNYGCHRKDTWQRCWGWARLSMRKITRQSVEKNLRIGDAQQNTHTERERERHKEYIYIHRDATITT